MEKVRIISGVHYRRKITNEVFDLVKPIQSGKKGSFITVKPNKPLSQGRKTMRIRVSPSDIVLLDRKSKSKSKFKSGNSKPTTQKLETDEEVITRITERFDILDEMTKATIATDIRAMIVSGPPGVGKSYGVEKQLVKASMFDVIASISPKYEVIKGAMTPLGLYATLYKHSVEGNVIVFDDCDMVLQDDLSLNLLKAALDSGKKRRLFWNSDSHMLRREGIPISFDFEGAVIFITNLKFNHVRSQKLQDHLEALQSRCHYLDLTLDTMRDKVLRVKQIASTGELFNDYNKIDEKAGMEIIDFMEKHKDDLREMSLRMALKIADLRSISEDRWEVLAKNTCMKNSF
jgi:hypothetical protein